MITLEEIRDAKKYLGWRNQDFADRLQVSKAIIDNYMAGRPMSKMGKAAFYYLLKDAGVIRE